MTLSEFLDGMPQGSAIEVGVGPKDITARLLSELHRRGRVLTSLFPGFDMMEGVRTASRILASVSDEASGAWTYRHGDPEDYAGWIEGRCIALLVLHIPLGGASGSLWRERLAPNALIVTTDGQPPVWGEAEDVGAEDNLLFWRMP